MPGVRLVERRPQDGDRAPARVHRGFVGGRIRARGQARDDHETLANELARGVG
jgi:hypothetical protein